MVAITTYLQYKQGEREKTYINKLTKLSNRMLISN